MILAGAQDISKSYSSKSLFSSLSFSIESRDRVGLIGPNGAGKSTLLRILAGRESADDGQLTLQKGLRIGFLEQVPSFSDQATIHSAVLEGVHDSEDWSAVAKVYEVLSKLELSTFDSQTLVTSLSGGWKKRVALARELVREPDLLLLDEPTNHLDVESILWLEELLAKAPFATVTITHDRLFLQKISNRIIELDPRHPGGLLSLNGSYSDFLIHRDETLSAQEQHEARLKNTLRRETEWLRRGAQGRQTKQRARMEATKDLAETVEDLSQRNKKQSVRLDFRSTEKTPKKLIEAKAISKRYGDRLVVPKMDLLITPKSRIALMGSNGCGKSTLIRLLTKTETPDTGEVFHADQLKVSYFEQSRESLDPQLTVLKTLCPSGEKVHYSGQDVHIRSYLSRFLFSYDQMDAHVRKLSGGEQSRLLLAKLMLSEANLLVLDEPTNDLDMATLDVLAEVLNEFKGAVLLVTHDRYFLDQISNQIIAFGLNKKGYKELTSLVGLDQWEEWYVGQRRDQVEREKISKKNMMGDAGTPSKKVKLSYKDQRELDMMESNIKAAEGRLADLEQQTLDSGLSPSRLQEISQAMSEVQNEIDRLYARWAELGLFTTHRIEQ